MRDHFVTVNSVFIILTPSVDVFTCFHPYKCEEFFRNQLQSHLQIKPFMFTAGTVNLIVYSSQIFILHLYFCLNQQEVGSNKKDLALSGFPGHVTIKQVYFGLEMDKLMPKDPNDLPKVTYNK